MPISTANAYFGLTALGKPTRSNVSGVSTIGRAAETISLTDLIGAPDHAVAYSVRLTMGDGATPTLDLTTGIVTGDTAGTAHVETATVVHAGTTSGTDTKVVVTIASSLYFGPNKVFTVNIPLASSTADTIAGLIRAALAADTDISTYYTISGTGPDVVLTQITNDGEESINIALANGSPTAGITPANTSTTTTPGVPRVVVEDSGVDHEGKTVVQVSKVHALAVLVDGAANISMASGNALLVPAIQGNTTSPGRFFLFGETATVLDLGDPLEITAADPSSTVDIIVIGTSA